MTEARDIRIGEVVEASSIGFLTQCYRLYDAPPLGSLVRAGGPHPPYGLVYQLSTTGIDTSRRPVVLGVDEETEEGIYSSNPQIASLLSTEFQAVIVGHQHEGRIQNYLPPLPPPIYCFVNQCTTEEVIEITQDTDFIRQLISLNISGLDEVIAACIRSGCRVRKDSSDFLVNVGKKLTAIFKDDFSRVSAILGKIRT